MVIVDSHCHLADVSKKLQQPIDQILQNAIDNDVKYILTISTNLLNIVSNVQIANNYKNVVCAIGVHPEHSNENVDIKEIEKYINDEKVVAIGEIGLDFFYKTVAKDKQIALLEQMFAIAPNLPRILHARECMDTIISIIDNFNGIHGVFHCYTDSLENVKCALDRGFFISFSGIATFKKSQYIREIAKYVPLDRILIETDAPFLAPEPMRGKINEPAYTKFTAIALAAELNIVIEKFAEITTENFFKCFPKASILLN